MSRTKKVFSRHCASMPQFASPGLGDTLSGPFANPVLHDVIPLNFPRFCITRKKSNIFLFPRHEDIKGNTGVILPIHNLGLIWRRVVSTTVRPL